MKNIYRRKKGMTLIEAIISVALFSILIIPISGVIMTAFQTSKKAESKQRASYVGQSILEEMEVYDEILLKEESGKSSFKLLDGDKIYESQVEPEGSTYVGELDRDGFKVEVTLIKDENFKYETSNDVNSSEEEMDFKLELLRDAMGQLNIKSGMNTKFVSNDVVLKLDNLGNMTLTNKGLTQPVINEGKLPNSKNKISIDINDSFDNDEVNIEVQNEIVNESGSKEELKIYVKRHKGATGIVNVIGTKGKVKIYENIGDTSIGETGDLYNIQVDVKDEKNSDVIFTGKTIKNIVIKK